MRIPAFVATLAISTLALTGVAEAHAHLKTADPAAGAIASPPPKVLTLTFSEGVVPKLSGVEVTMDDGMDMGPATVATAPGKSKVLIVTLPAPLDPGSYKVHWHVVAEDGHKTQGDYTFSVK